MAPIDNIRCLACKKKGEKLEDWEYEAEALGPEDIGEYSTDLHSLCWHQHGVDSLAGMHAEIKVTHNGICHSGNNATVALCMVIAAASQHQRC